MKIISIFTVLSILSFNLLANSSIDKSVLEFEKKRISQNTRIELNSVTINTKKELPLKNWYGYILDVDAKVQDKQINVKDILFTNGEIMAPDLIDMKTGNSLKSQLQPKLSDEYHSKRHLIAGNHKAKDKIVVFSDPLCGFCMDYLPDLIKHTNKNSDKIALYYYHFPLIQIHPAALSLSKMMIVAREKGIKGIELKVYTSDWDKYFTGKEKDESKILKAFNTEFKTNITLEEINKEKVLEEIKVDIKMGDNVMVNGTPTIFINKELDKTKMKYEMLGE